MNDHNDSTFHPALFYLTFVIIPQLLLPLFLARAAHFKPEWTNYLFFASIACISIFPLLFLSKQLSSGDPHIDGLLGTAVGGSLFNALHFVLLVDPVKEYRHRTDINTEDVANSSPIEQRPYWKRVYWVLCANFSIRGIGWNFQVPHITIQHHKNRLTFTFFAFTRILGFFLLANAVQYMKGYMMDYYSYSEFAFTGPKNTGISIDMDSAQTVSATATIFGTFNGLSSSFQFLQQIIPVAGQGLGGIHWHSLSLALARRATATIASALEDYCRLSQMYYTLAILGAVLLRLSAPEDWPPLFGSWGEAWSVRNFWGRTWHQMIRRLCVSPGRFISKALGIPSQSRSIPAALIQLYTAFLVSGIVHSFGDYRFDQSISNSSQNQNQTQYSKKRLGRSLLFFTLQSVAITLEEVVMRVWASASGGYSAAEQLQGRSRIRILAFRAIGYLWVLGWFMMTMPLLLDSESNS